jgi:hypothetical protein
MRSPNAGIGTTHSMIEPLGDILFNLWKGEPKVQPISGTDLLVQLIPALLIWLIFVPIIWRLARRKGVRPLSIAIGCFPIWFGIAVIYWASLTDKDVLDRLARLEGTGGSH